MSKIVLRFVGHGAIVGVPARDLTLDDIKQRGLDFDNLIKTGLWVKVEAQKKEKKSDVEKNGGE